MRNKCQELPQFGNQISLVHCRKFTDKGLPYLHSCKGCHKIICLEIPGCVQVCTDVSKNTANGCNWIQDLLISKMLTLTDRCIKALVENCQQVMSVIFLDSPKLSDTTFKVLAECKPLKVSIEGNNQTADLSFKLMSKCCPYMRHIHVADCQWITEAGAKMISLLKHILVLNMADCTRYPPKLLYHFSGQDKENTAEFVGQGKDRERSVTWYCHRQTRLDPDEEINLLPIKSE
ncbi:F-box and leucine-rich repeat protein 13 [Zonotrichia leucophrys gambelii]|uniref:F-box and leucine-rich repeat protein 13 n=1 Tax=Zonotrichia leucophrys gambelii TaxID=257770 RepID=UPI003140868D